MIEDMYKDNILDHYRYPRNFGKLQGAQHTWLEFNSLCGDQIEMQVKEGSNGSVQVMFTGKGCAISQASASMLTEMANGKSIDEIKEVTKDQLLEELGIELSPARLKCALISLIALLRAVSQAQLIKKPTVSPHHGSATD